MSDIPSPATTDELAAHVSALRADLAALQAYVSFLPRAGDVDFKAVFR